MPRETAEWRSTVELVRVTFSMLMSFITGALMVVMRRRMAEAKSRKVPTWWKSPVFAIVMRLWFDFFALRLRWYYGGD